MRRVSYFCFGIGILISLYIYITRDSIWDFLNAIIIYTMLSFGLKRCNNQKSLANITFFAIWVTIYNIVFVILFNISSIDLLKVEWRYFVQLFIPFLIITILKYKQVDN